MMPVAKTYLVKNTGPCVCVCVWHCRLIPVHIVQLCGPSSQEPIKSPQWNREMAISPCRVHSIQIL